MCLKIADCLRRTGSLLSVWVLLRSPNTRRSLLWPCLGKLENCTELRHHHQYTENQIKFANIYIDHGPFTCSGLRVEYLVISSLSRPPCLPSRFSLGVAGSHSTPSLPVFYSDALVTDFSPYLDPVPVSK